MKKRGQGKDVIVRGDIVSTTYQREERYQSGQADLTSLHIFISQTNQKFQLSSQVYRYLLPLTKYIQYHFKQ